MKSWFWRREGPARAGEFSTQTVHGPGGGSGPTLVHDMIHAEPRQEVWVDWARPPGPVHPGFLAAARNLRSRDGLRR